MCNWKISLNFHTHTFGGLGGRYASYAGSSSDRVSGIVSAISTDGGMTFALEDGVRVPKGDSPFEQHNIFAPEVVAIGDDGTYRMYYAGIPDPTSAVILSAFSADGLVWTKEPEPVVLPGGPYDRVKASEMCKVPLARVTAVCRRSGQIS